jgi:hypothetical protein
VRYSAAVILVTEEFSFLRAILKMKKVRARNILESSELFATRTLWSLSIAFVFSRLVECMGEEGDVIIGISTSGRSKNIVEAYKIAKEKKMNIISLTGCENTPMSACSDCVIKVPDVETARIQECHILIGHIICEIVEHKLFKK